MTETEAKQHAHDPNERMTPRQVPALVETIQRFLDPIERSIAFPPIDDEPVSEDEARRLSEARASVARGEAISNKEVLAEFGLSEADFERMAREPLDDRDQGR